MVISISAPTAALEQESGPKLKTGRSRSWRRSDAGAPEQEFLRTRDQQHLEIQNNSTILPYVPCRISLFAYK